QTAFTASRVALELKVTLSGAPPVPPVNVATVTEPYLIVLPETATWPGPDPWWSMESRSLASLLIRRTCSIERLNQLSESWIARSLLISWPGPPACTTTTLPLPPVRVGGALMPAAEATEIWQVAGRLLMPAPLV